PDGRHFLYEKDNPQQPAMSGIYVGSLDSRRVQDSNRLLASDSAAIFAPSSDSRDGYLLFERDSTLFAQRFDPKKLEVAGEAMTLVDRIAFVFFPSFSASSNGTLVYAGTSPRKVQPTWFDKDGHIVGKSGPPVVSFGMEATPDGNRIASTVFDA